MADIFLDSQDGLGIVSIPPPATTTRPNSHGFDGHPFTDVGNAQRLVARFGTKLRYCRTWKSWFVWDGKRWKKDKTGRIDLRAKETIRALYHEAIDCQDTGQRDAALGHARASEYEGRIRAMVRLAESEPNIPIEPNQLDADPMLLNCLNGTVDLRTGELRNHTQADLITKLAPVKFDPNADCPLFDGFLHKIMGGDDELVRYLQRAVGYSLTGDVGEKAIFFLYGEGNNGKTTFLEVIRAAMGDYAGQVPVESLMSRHGDSISNDIACLQGLRFVTSSEAEQGRKLAEAKVKQLTGMGTVKARFLYGEFFEFAPTFKIFLDANYKPEIKGVDQAIWSRIRLVPFTVSIPKEEIDKKLLLKLRDELAGILAWMVRGCLEWQKNSLAEPTAVLEATGSYQEQMDTVGDFIDDACELGDYDVASSELYSAYKAWCKENDEEADTQKRLGTALAKKGLKSTKVKGKRGWKGIRLPIGFG